MDLAALEIGLFPGVDGILADIRFSPSATSTDQVLGRSLPVPLDTARLSSLALDPTGYAIALTEMLFSERQMVSAWHHARAYSDAIEIPLHVRLRISDDLPILHDIRWELLRDPNSGEDLSRSGRVWISRALDRIDTPQRDLPTRKMIRSLVVLASPPDLGRFGMAPIPVEVGLRAAQALLPLPTMLIDGSAGHYANLQTISCGLWRSSGILVVFAHGVRADGEVALVMQNDDGTRQMVSAGDMVEVLGGLPRMPVAVVLVSCMSGGMGDGFDDGLTSLGGSLARRGVSAVLALAGMAQMSLADSFVPTFLSDLSEHGDALNALGRARATLPDDRWMPRLWLNGRSGQLWEVPPRGNRWLTGVGLWLS
ncbi:CHAT domain-containing protein [Chloroflexales bacterium ZM16-3]|nr:CHAT domain-containing protein [Chloroflexales bacterium ZM16-3]